MPWLEPQKDAITLESPMGQPLDLNAPAPNAVDVIGSAFSRENLVVNMARKLSEERYPIDLNYNPMNDERVKGTKFESQYTDRFTYSYSAKDTERIIADIEREERDNSVLNAGGWAGFGASFVAGLLDPTILLPGGAIYRAGKGVSTLKTAASISGAAAASVGIQEAGLQFAQRTRPIEESVFNIGAATLLSSFCGGVMKLARS